MKILMMIAGYPLKPTEYIGQYVKSLAIELTKLGYEISVVCKSSENVQLHSIQEGIDIRCFNAPSLEFGDCSFLSKAIFFIKMLIKGFIEDNWFKPDIIHGWSAVPGGVVANNVAGHKPNIISLIGTGMRKGTQSKLVRSMIKCSLDDCTHYTSDDQTEMFEIADRIGVTNQNRSFIPLGVDTERFKPEPRKEYINGKKIILLVGRLVPERGQLLAIRSMTEVLKYHPDAHLVLVGDGPDRAMLETKVGEWKLDNVVSFIGDVDNSEISLYYSYADVVLMLSDKTVFSSIALFEAGACGKCVIASRLPDTHLLIKDNVTGFVVDDNPINVATKINLALNSPDKRDCLGKALRKIVLDKYSVKQAAKKYEELYCQFRVKDD